MLDASPSVHELCSGPYLQEALIIEDGTYVVPLDKLGYNPQVAATIRYAASHAGIDVKDECQGNLEAQGALAMPTVAIIVAGRAGESPDELERVALPRLDVARKTVAWASGDPVVPFARLVWDGNQSYLRMLPPHSRNRIRLGFGNTGKDYYDLVTRVVRCAEADPHFGFALSLFGDAQNEGNALFKAARMFTVLECLAQGIKRYINANHPQFAGKPNGVGSRKAIRTMLGVKATDTMEVAMGTSRVRFEPIEVAGRIRDFLFHGVQPTAEREGEQYRDVWEFVLKHPEHVIDAMDSHCWLEISRWANNASRGRCAQEGREVDVSQLDI